MTLPGLVSQDSAAQDGAWLPVPDSRRWVEPDAPRSPQLQMLWPLGRPLEAPQVEDDYLLRLFRDGDQANYINLMTKAGFENWDDRRVAQVRREVTPGGLFVVEHKPTGRLVATAQAQHKPRPDHPEGGEMAWVAADPDHRGHHLGRIVVAAATRRLLGAGYRRIYLLTDDHRLPALAIYLRMGWQPIMTSEAMRDRWRRIITQVQDATDGTAR